MFSPKLYHSILLRFNVFEDSSLPDPDIPPFYSLEFFKKIKEVHQTAPLNIATMTERQWYQLLLEDSCTMEVDSNEQRKYIPTRVELAIPSNNWDKTWRLSRLRGLGPDHTTFLFKLMHKLLVTKERLTRTNPTASPLCVASGCRDAKVETIEHALIECEANAGVGKALLQTFRQQQPGLSVEAVLHLQLDVPAEEELASTWLLAATLLSIWEQRQASQKVRPYLVRAELEAKVNMLRETRLSNTAIILETKLNLMFDEISC